MSFLGILDGDLGGILEFFVMGLLRRFARNDGGWGNGGVFGSLNGIAGVEWDCSLFFKPRNDGGGAITRMSCNAPV